MKISLNSSTFSADKWQMGTTTNSKNRLAILRSNSGISLIEIMISIAILSVVVSMTFVPMIQFKKTEKMADLQSSIDLQHQISIQKARNVSFIKKILKIDPADTAKYDVAKLKCFQQAGTGCTAYTVTNAQAEAPEVFRSGGLAGSSSISYSVNCTATTCTDVTLSVITQEGGGVATSGSKNTGVTVRSRSFKSIINASSLASRSDINFANCSMYFLTGVGFKDLKGQCAGFNGMTSCNGNGDRPMMLFGQTGAEVCQVTTSKVCNNFGYTRGGNFQNDPSCSSGGVGPVLPLPSPIAAASATPSSSPATGPSPASPTVLKAASLVCTSSGGGSGVAIDVKTGDTLTCTITVDNASTDWLGCAGSDSSYCVPTSTNLWVKSASITSAHLKPQDWQQTSNFSASFSYVYTGVTPEHLAVWGPAAQYKYLSAMSYRDSSTGKTEYSTASQVGIRFVDAASAAPDFTCTVSVGGKVVASSKDGPLYPKIGSVTNCSLALKAPSVKWSGCHGSSSDSSACSWLTDSFLMTSQNGFPAWTGATPNYSYEFNYTDCAKNPHGTGMNYWFAKGTSATGVDSTVSAPVAIQYMCDDTPPVMTCQSYLVDKITGLKNLATYSSVDGTNFKVPYGAEWNCQLTFASGTGRTQADGQWKFWGEAAVPPNLIDSTGFGSRHLSDIKTGWTNDPNSGSWKIQAGGDGSKWIRDWETNDGSSHPLGLLPGPAKACFQIGDLVNMKTSTIMCFDVGGPDYSATWCPVSALQAPTSLPPIMTGQPSAKCPTCNSSFCLPGGASYGPYLPGDNFKDNVGGVWTCKADLSTNAAPPSNSLACETLKYNAWCAVDPKTGLGTGFSTANGGVYHKPGCYMDVDISPTGALAFYNTNDHVIAKDKNLYVCMTGTETAKPDISTCQGVSFAKVYNNWCEVNPVTGLGVRLTVQPTGILSMPPGCNMQASLDPSGVETFYKPNDQVTGKDGKIYVCLTGTTTEDVSINACKDVSFKTPVKCPSGSPNWSVICTSPANCASVMPAEVSDKLMPAWTAEGCGNGISCGVTVYNNPYPHTRFGFSSKPEMTCDESKIGVKAMVKMMSCGGSGYCGGTSYGFECGCGTPISNSTDGSSCSVQANGKTYNGTYSTSANGCVFQACDGSDGWNCARTVGAGRELDGRYTGAKTEVIGGSVGHDANAAGFCNMLGANHYSHKRFVLIPSCGKDYGIAEFNGSGFPWYDTGLCLNDTPRDWANQTRPPGIVLINSVWCVSDSNMNVLSSASGITLPPAGSYSDDPGYVAFSEKCARARYGSDGSACDYMATVSCTRDADSNGDPVDPPQYTCQGYNPKNDRYPDTFKLDHDPNWVDNRDSGGD